MFCCVFLIKIKCMTIFYKMLLNSLLSCLISNFYKMELIYIILILEIYNKSSGNITFFSWSQTTWKKFRVYFSNSAMSPDKMSRNRRKECVMPKFFIFRNPWVDLNLFVFHYGILLTLKRCDFWYLILAFIPIGLKLGKR